MQDAANLFPVIDETDADRQTEDTPRLSDEFVAALHGKGEDESREMVEAAGGRLHVAHVDTVHASADGCVVSAELTSHDGEVTVVIARYAGSFQGPLEETNGEEPSDNGDDVDEHFDAVAADNEALARSNGGGVDAPAGAEPDVFFDEPDEADYLDEVAVVDEADESLADDDFDGAFEEQVDIDYEPVSEPEFYDFETDPDVVDDLDTAVALENETPPAVENDVVADDDTDDFEWAPWDDETGAIEDSSENAPAAVTGHKDQRRSRRTAMLIGIACVVVVFLFASLLTAIPGPQSDPAKPVVAEKTQPDKSRAGKTRKKARKVTKRRRASARRTEGTPTPPAPSVRPPTNQPAPVSRSCGAAAAEFSVDC